MSSFTPGSDRHSDVAASDPNRDPRYDPARAASPYQGVSAATTGSGPGFVKAASEARGGSKGNLDLDPGPDAVRSFEPAPPPPPDSKTPKPPSYPQCCGWCNGPVLCAEGWLLHGFGYCLLLDWIAMPKCFVSVSPDVYEWLTA